MCVCVFSVICLFYIYIFIYIYTFIISHGLWHVAAVVVIFVQYLVCSIKFFLQLLLSILNDREHDHELSIIMN